MSRGLAAVLAGACVAGALALPASSRTASPEGTEASERGRAEVEKSCLRCHPGPDLDRLVRDHASPAELPAALDAFLVGHHVPDDVLRAEVIAVLMRRLEHASGDPP